MGGVQGDGSKCGDIACSAVGPERTQWSTLHVAELLGALSLPRSICLALEALRPWMFFFACILVRISACLLFGAGLCMKRWLSEGLCVFMLFIGFIIAFVITSFHPKTTKGLFNGLFVRVCDDAVGVALL